MAAVKTAKKGAKRNVTGFTDEEKAAMREHVQELQARARRGGAKPDEEADVLAKIAKMAPKDRAMAQKIHAIVKANAPTLSPRLWYGMPAYAKDGVAVMFFQDAAKFKTRYGTLGFNNKANLDEGNMWPTAYALLELTPAEEAKIAALVKKAVR
jgi:uncharacterized protein YdhG (YjbR/CyaY superfamily)